MPHLILDYSHDLDADIPAACDTLFDAMAGHEAFPDPEAIKLRAAAWSNYRSGTKGGTFAHATIRLLSGRTPEAKADLSATILAAMRECLSAADSLTVEIRDMDRDSYAKHIK